jgi:hypothetical protein
MTEPFVIDGIWIPRAIIAIASRYAVPLYLELRCHCYESPECFPGHRRLAHAIGCAIGTVNVLTERFHALGIVRKTHRGRHCVYRFAEACWRRRRLRKSAHCSAKRTEDRSNFVESTDKGQNHKKYKVSQFVAYVGDERRAKRQSMLRSLRRWVECSPHLPDAERPHRLAMLDRATAALDAWAGRSAEDKRAFEILVDRARGRPLDSAVTDSLRQQPSGMRAIGAFLPVLGYMPANPAVSRWAPGTPAEG